MANISTYPIAAPTTADLIPGTQKYTDGTGKQYNLTKNFTIASVLALGGGGGGGAGDGTVTSISFDAPLTGGTITTTGSVGISQADSTTNGFLSAANFNVFAGKQDPITLTTTGTTGAATFSGTTLNIPIYAGGGGGSVSSVGLSMPAAFTVANSPVTGSDVLTVTGSGNTNQYIDGTGSLQAFPVIPSAYTWRIAGGTGGGTVANGDIVAFLPGASGGITTNYNSASLTMKIGIDYAGSDNLVALAPALPAGQAVEISDTVIIGNTNVGAEGAYEVTIKDLLSLYQSLGAAVPEVYFSCSAPGGNATTFANQGNTATTEFNAFGAITVVSASVGLLRFTFSNNMGTDYIVNWTIEDPLESTSGTSWGRVFNKSQNSFDFQIYKNIGSTSVTNKLVNFILYK